VAAITAGLCPARCIILAWAAADSLTVSGFRTAAVLVVVSGWAAFAVGVACTEFDGVALDIAMDAMTAPSTGNVASRWILPSLNIRHEAGAEGAQCPCSPYRLRMPRRELRDLFPADSVREVSLQIDQETAVTARTAFQCA
jgi:hypothetical protein